MKKDAQVFLLTLVAAILLAAILTPTACQFRNEDKFTACKSNLKNIGTALEIYSTDWSGHYPRNLEALVPDYLYMLPTCPAAGYDTYRATFGAKAPGNEEGFEDYFFLECAGQNHDGYLANTPFYDGLRCVLER